MSLGRPLFRAYLGGLAAALPLGAMVGAAISLALVFSNSYSWQTGFDAGKVVASSADAALFGVVVAAFAAVGSTVVLLVGARIRPLGRTSRVAAVALGAAAGVAIGLLAASAVRDDSILPQLMPFMAFLSMLFAAVVASVVERRAVKRAARRQVATS